ncbi:hypothetical protein [uncultured Dysgonomonas sp.]|uniref:TonB-dependent receptor-like beta-barrel domain-containing protein n=1 Tax=uncultured Dysgonomonas sp. TaxID=206096 RepID=A0A212J9Q3_9BACT|nr:hypothetical protein [uncultured Dysgonomonas sp.]SBV96158.1 conserved exported hypothetical protein [uncultured Dysgonomonas sp.]
MKTLYKSVFVIALGIISLTATAQKDSTLIRQVLLERDYNPTLQDASKVNTQPSIYSPVIKAKELKFVSTVPQITLTNNKLGSAAPSDINTGVDYSKKRGYLILGAGNNSNLEGAFGYRLVNGDRDRLDISATHSSTSANVDYINADPYTMDEAKAKYSASKVNLKYQHMFDPSVLWFDASFYNTSYNYYGNPFISNTSSAIYPFDMDSRQNVDIFSIGAGLKSSDKNEGILKYKGGVRYQNFKSKYGIYTNQDGPKGGQLDLNADFYTELGSDRSIGVKGFIMNQSFSSKNETFDKDAFHSFTNITATPYIKFQGGNWDADLGVNVSGMFDTKTKVLVSPNVKAAIHINDVNTFYGEVTGGVNNNTYLDVLQENRYVNPIARVEYSKTLFDARLGFRSGVVSGFEFDIFAGYKKTDKDHLYLAESLYNPPADGGYASDVMMWGNVGTPLYANVGTGHVGGLLKTKLIPYTDLSAKITAYFYDVKYANGNVTLIDKDLYSEKKAWGRPTFTAELNADIKPIDKLTFSLNYLYAGGRKTVYSNYMVPVVEVVKMKDINELNFRGEYQVTDWLSVNAKVNNLLFQKYELQYGYALQGFNVLGGLSFKF